MTRPDVALISPFPSLGERHGGWTGVASYSANLAGALTDAGARVTVLASAEDGEPAVARDGTTEVRRVWKRGPAALPAAAAAARATGAPAVHLQHELFLYGGPAAVPGIVPALAGLRAGRRRAVVTMHHVVDPGRVDASFTRTHRVRAPAGLVRAGVHGIHGAIRALAGTVVVHEPAFADVVAGAEVVPHGIETPERADRAGARADALEAPAEGGKVRDEAEVRAIASPDDADNVVTFQRRVGAGGAWTAIGTDSSSPVYTAFDDVSGLEPGTAVSYRAVLDYGAGTVTSAERSVTVAPPPLATAMVHDQRSGGDYAGWGLHLWGDAIADGVATAWSAPRPPTRTEANGTVTFDIPLEDDTKAVTFIVHQPEGDSVPATRDPGGDRSFVPIDHPEIWLKGGDETVYTTPQF